jgi:transposase-like protein
VDETYVKVHREWRYLYRAIDKHGVPMEFLLTAKRDLDAAKRFFRKMLQDQPLLGPHKIGTDGANVLSARDRRRVESGLDAEPRHASRVETFTARGRERPFPRKEEHAQDRRLSNPSPWPQGQSPALRRCSYCLNFQHSVFSSRESHPPGAQTQG